MQTGKRWYLVECLEILNLNGAKLFLGLYLLATDGRISSPNKH